MFWFKKINQPQIMPNIPVINPSEQDATGEAYFEEAKSWAYERYQMQEVIANRWQFAFWGMMIFSVLLLVMLIMLFPLKSWEPIVVQRNTQTGEVWVDSARNHYLPETSPEVESDLVRYVVARETFSLTDNNARKKQVLYASSPQVSKDYEAQEDGHNPKSPINVYGMKGLRTVKVEDVVFIDNASNALEQRKQQKEKIPTLAKVDFTTTETIGQITVQKNWVATLSFKYLGTPDEKEAAWLNWNGFTVIDYRVDQRNI